MLKPMQSKKSAPNPLYLWGLVALLAIAGIVVLVTAFSGNDNSEDEVAAVYTNAAATVAAQQLTLQASSPTETQVLFTPTIEATFTPFASPTLFATQGSVVNPPANTGSNAVGCNNSEYVADVTVPDETVMTPGQTFTKTWKLQNTGSCPWTTAFKVSFVSGNAMGGTVTALTTTVQPGQSGDVSVSMTAPTTAGDAIGYWILTNDSGQNFGTSFYVKINVGGASTSGTVTAGTATTTGSLPAPATSPVITLDCTPNGAQQYEYTGTLTWTYTSNNELGFNIYVDEVLADIAPKTPYSYKVKVNGRVTNVIYDKDTVITYKVKAYNAYGEAAPATVTGKCP